jgi:phosphoribosylanthranilate isomerase
MRMNDLARGRGSVAGNDLGQQRVTVKICGLTCEGDARLAVDAGADYLGFVFFPRSRRCLATAACEWIRGLGGARKVGVFRDQPIDFILRIREAAGLDLVQLHGEETPETCAALGGRESVVKAIAPSASIDWAGVAAVAEVARVLFDTASPSGGGTGRRFDWSRLDGRPATLGFWLAGGLDPECVGAAVRTLHPAGVDVASGVEAAVGRKDPAKIRAFLAAVREAER